MSMAILLGSKEKLMENIPVDAKAVVQIPDMTKEDMFKKIKAEIEGGLFEELLRKQEDNNESLDSQDLNVLDKVMFDKDEIIRRYKPQSKLLAEFGW
jgi:arsenate reductase-like glutaredoxin family protein